MTSSPDKLFRDGLGEYRKPASDSAWERIETRLQRKQQKILWLRIAASITLIVAVSFILWPVRKGIEGAATNSEVSTDLLVDKGSKVFPEADPFTAIPSLPKVPVPDEKANTQKQTVKNPHHPFKSAREILPVDFQPEGMGSLISVQVESISDQDPRPAEATIVSIAHPGPPTTGMYLTYSAMDVQIKFRKKHLPIETTQEKKSSTAMQKVMALAYELKNDDSTYGDLRQKKNEILSFEFTDKRTGPNK